MDEFIHRDCPCCGASAGLAKRVVSSSERAENLSFEVLRECWRGFRRGAVFFSYYRCPDCGLLYCPIYFNDEQLRILYRNMGDNSAGLETDSLEKTQRSYFDVLNRKTKIEGHWIEIGADLGIFAALIANSPNISSFSIIEPNLNSHAHLSQMVSSQGSLTSSWSEITIDSKFHGVIGIHVLDHLLNLKSDLEEINSRLNSRGKVFFVTHDEYSMLRRVLGIRWPPFCLQHPQVFNKNSISKCLKSAGFSDIQIVKSTNHVTLRHLVTVCVSLLGIGESILKITPKMSLNFRLGNFITYAEKLT